VIACVIATLLIATLVRDPSTFSSMQVPRKEDEAMLGHDGLLSPREKWGLQYMQTLFNRGTHYILLDSVHTIACRMHCGLHPTSAC